MFIPGNKIDPKGVRYMLVLLYSETFINVRFYTVENPNNEQYIRPKSFLCNKKPP